MISGNLLAPEVLDICVCVCVCVCVCDGRKMYRDVQSFRSARVIQGI